MAAVKPRSSTFIASGSSSCQRVVISARRFFASASPGPEDGGSLARHTLAQAMRDLGQHVALQVHGAALAAHRRQEAAHRSRQARVLVGDHQFDAAETSLQELLEELGPTVL